MEQIDEKFERFCKLLEEVKDYGDTIFTEQDTRVKIIDRILIEILSWPYEEISTEPSIEDGFIDYRLSVNGIPRLIIEAKKSGVSFGLESDYSGRNFKLNGPVLKEDSARKGIKQAIHYCAFNSVELACLSNGNEWIIFRGNRLADGREVMSGTSFVFSSLEMIRENFKLFFQMLNFENVGLFKYRAYFQEAEGEILRVNKSKNYIFHPDSRIFIDRKQHSQDFDKVMNLFFQKLSGDEDPEMLIDCFIHTKESDLANRKIGRIAEDLRSTVKKLSTDTPSLLFDAIERVKSSERNEFVIIIGGKGAGKSTFIERFFKVVLPPDLQDDCITIQVNLAESEGNEKTIIDWLNSRLVDVAEKKVFDGNPTYDELQGMFFHEYDRWTKSQRHLYDSDKTQFKIEFGRHIEDRREKRPQEYIKRIVRDIVKSRKKVPCIIFDNADHFSIEFQERVFQYARSIYEEEICLIIVPITDKTSWQLSRQGAMQSFDNEVLFLPTPSPKYIIRERIKYIEKKVKEEKSSKAQYFLGKGIRLSIKDLTGFVSALQSILLQNPKVATWVGNLGNLDVRRCLELTRELIGSNHLDLESYIKVYLAGNALSIKNYFIVRAIIKGRYNIYPVGGNKYVQNIFFLTDEFTTSPLVAVRILRLLLDKRGHHDSKEDNEYITVNQTIDYFHAIGIDNNITLTYLDALLKTGLCYSYDPTIYDIRNAKKIQLSPSGKQHYYWAVQEEQYLQCMLEVTPILRDDVFEDLSQYRHPSLQDDWSKRLTVFLQYLLNEDEKFCSIPDHEAYKNQKNIIETYSRQLRRFQKMTM